MLSAHQISKTFQIQPILQQISVSLTPQQRVGLIGPNGCGKTTFLRILAGLETPDRGAVSRVPAGLQIGYLAQGFTLPAHLTIGQVLQPYADRLETLEAELAAAGEALSAGAAHSEAEQRKLAEAFDLALNRLELAAQQELGSATQVRKMLGLDQIPDDFVIGRMSGGQKTRLLLALILLQSPDVLLLDEPTNHLDIPMLEWLEGWIQAFPGPVLIVSHDRTFLDHCVNEIWDLDPASGAIRAYPGNYSDYVDAYLHEKDLQLQSWKDQQTEIRRMEQDIQRTKQQSLQVELSTTPRQPGVRRYAKKVARKALSREKKLERYLESDERIDKPTRSWQMKLEFSGDPAGSREVLKLVDLSVGYDPARPLIRQTNTAIRHGERIVLTGLNGSGKSTLLKTIAGQIPALAGKVSTGASIRTGMMSQEQDLLDWERNPLETILAAGNFNETEARSFLHYFLFSGDQALRQIGQLSYGERARLSLAFLVAQGSNFLLLDEPINHLDIPARERFEQALSNFEGTILAVVHDRYFIERFADKVWRLDDGKITVEPWRT